LQNLYSPVQIWVSPPKSKPSNPLKSTCLRVFDFLGWNCVRIPYSAFLLYLQEFFIKNFPQNFPRKFELLLCSEIQYISSRESKSSVRIIERSRSNE
ncbi:MAG TPA: hypothetical protein VM577_17820, partial [Anaerovoracaceae bacterium]|nr:hypothetical protein [Anaerovoracaceae bacterium]